MPRRTTTTIDDEELTLELPSVISNDELISTMNQAVLDMTPKPCRHVPKDEELLNVDCDDCIRETEISSLRSRLALEVENEDVANFIKGVTAKRSRKKDPAKKELPPLPTELKVSIEKHRGYRGWFWGVEKAYDYHSDGDIWWRDICRGGYSITRRGARWAAHRAVKKYLSYQENQLKGKNSNEYFIDRQGNKRLEPGGIPLPSRK